MNNILSLTLLCTIIIVISGCSQNTAHFNECAKACSVINPSETAPHIKQTELEAGMYYGYLEQKKKGTPDDWVHILGETKSSQWRTAAKAKNYDCDCLTNL